MTNYMDCGKTRNYQIIQSSIEGLNVSDLETIKSDTVYKFGGSIEITKGTSSILVKFTHNGIVVRSNTRYSKWLNEPKQKFYVVFYEIIKYDVDSDCLIVQIIRISS